LHADGQGVRLTPPRIRSDAEPLAAIGELAALDRAAPFEGDEANWELLDFSEAGRSFGLDEGGQTALVGAVLEAERGAISPRASTLTFGREALLVELRNRGWRLAPLGGSGQAARRDVILALGFALNAFDEETITSLVERASAQLKPGGSFILEATSLYHACHAVCDWRTISDGLLLREADFDPVECAQLVRHLVVAADRLIQVAARLRTLTCPEWLRLLDEHGLTPFGIYGDWDGSSYTDSSPRLVIRARKARAGGL